MAYIGSSPTSTAFVTDSFNGNASTTVFTMSVAPANPSSALVAISGVLQDPTTYAVSGTSLTFSSAPPLGTGNISVRYLGIPASGITTTAYRTLTEFTATAGQTTFSPPSYSIGYINVYRNGSRLGTADFTATNGTSVVLNNAAGASDLVAIESFYITSVTNALPQTGGVINAPSGAVALQVQSNSAVGIYQDSSANVGIGNSSPTNKLDIIGGSNILGLTNTSASGYEAINMTVGTQQARIVLTGQSFGDGNYGTGDITIQAQTAGKGIRFGTNGGTNQMILDSTGLLTLSTGQIKFPVSQNASSDANTLDDYEEGTFTPIILGTTTNPTVSYGRQDGRYVKIGMFVYASGSMVVNTITGGSGTLALGGFPFASRNTNEADRTAINISYVSGFSSTTIPTSGIFNGGTTFAELLVFNSADARAGRTSYVNTPPASGFNIYYTCCYTTNT